MTGRSFSVPLRLHLHAQVQELIARLVAEEHYGLAVYVAKRWELDTASIWEAWARSLILCAHIPWHLACSAVAACRRSSIAYLPAAWLNIGVLGGGSQVSLCAALNANDLWCVQAVPAAPVPVADGVLPYCSAGWRATRMRMPGCPMRCARRRGPRAKRLPPPLRSALSPPLRFQDPNLLAPPVPVHDAGHGVGRTPGQRTGACPMGGSVTAALAPC